MAGMILKNIKSKAFLIEEERRHAPNLAAKSEAVKLAKQNGGACLNCKLFNPPKLKGGIGYCRSREAYRMSYNICENHQFI